MFTLNCNGRILVVDKPVVMGIINVTPDSFYAGSRHAQEDEVLHTAEKMLADGASILDLGGQSTRPGSERLEAGEELKRVLGAVKALAKRFPEAFISIDTYHAEVARAAVESGASIINDISGGMMDEKMTAVAAALKTPFVLMHMLGTPQTMQQDPRYDDVTRTVLDFFIERIALLERAGVHDVIIDPGFGFGKTIQQNFQLVRDLGVFRMLDAPILIGVSRKSSIAKTLGVPTEETLNGTTVLHTIGLMNGASILRVHDVKEAVQAVRLFLACGEPATQNPVRRS
jgi:dihydropteroate synthase